MSKIASKGPCSVNRAGSLASINGVDTQRFQASRLRARAVVETATPRAFASWMATCTYRASAGKHEEFVRFLHLQFFEEPAPSRLPGHGEGCGVDMGEAIGLLRHEIRLDS